MADSKPKPAIPSWQQPNTNATASNNSGSSPTSDDTSRSTLVEQASKFLQDDSIRDAPVDRKISFLESKGLRSDEIEGLLGVSRNPEATSSTATPTAEEKKSESETKTTTTTTSNEPTTSSTAPSPSPSPQTTTPAPAPTTTAAPRPAPARGDVPPIITYPEFLVNQPKPPPLVTLQSMLYTLYGAAGLGASIYGASEFLVKPMLASLTRAREELAETACANLTKLNEKLEQNVSTLPPQLTARKTDAASSASSENGDDESITSDPTELFHRDVAVQTSQELIQESLSSTAVNAADEAAAPDPLVAVNTHQKRLEIITSNLREFADLDKSSGTLDDSMRTNINDLQHYLDGLLYSKPGFGGVSSYGVYSTPGIDNNNGPSTGITKGEEDAISGFRSEIRGVKGALLSARNFPSGRGGRVGSSLSLGR